MFKRSTSGFTIVELLIVVVVISLLAAIVFVGFNSIQGRAANSSVQSDVKNNATRLGLFASEYGRPPTIAELSSVTSVQPKFSTGGSLKFASYCVADNQYVIGGQSKTDQKYYSVNGGGAVNNNTISMANICDSLGITKSGGATADTTILVSSPYTLSTNCATEGQTCTFSGSRVIAFGANGNYVYKAATGGIACTNVEFGSDPAPGTVKACYLTT